MSLERDIKLDIVTGKYKCISAYKIPDKPDEWLERTRKMVINMITE